MSRLVIYYLRCSFSTKNKNCDVKETNGSVKPLGGIEFVILELDIAQCNPWQSNCVKPEAEILAPHGGIEQWDRTRPGIRPG